MSRLSREKSVSRSHRDRGLIRRDRSHSAPRSVATRAEIVVCSTSGEVFASVSMGEEVAACSLQPSKRGGGAGAREHDASVGAVFLGVAHGSRTVAATDGAVPHDSAVPTDAECTRVCNFDCPRPGVGIRARLFMLSNRGDDRPRRMRAPAGLARNGQTRLIRPPAPRHRTPNRNDRSRAGDGPISARVATDLSTGCDRSRHGLLLISTRVATDLGGETRKMTGRRARP